MNIVILSHDQLATNAIINCINTNIGNHCHIKTFKAISDFHKDLLHNNTINFIFTEIVHSDILIDLFITKEISPTIIFMTSYDEYALDYFKKYSINYLLKPIQPDDLNLEILNNLSPTEKILNLKYIPSKPQKIKKQFELKVSNQFLKIDAVEINYFIEEKGVVSYYLITNKLFSDYTIDELAKILDPKIFYRLNKNLIINKHFVKEIIKTDKSSIEISLTNPSFKKTTLNYTTGIKLLNWYNND